MRCPKHPGSKLTKVRLDVYWCIWCAGAWLIHPLKYKTIEEAASVADPPKSRSES